MQRLEFSYSMKIAFSSPVVRHCFSLRCLPFSNAYQRVSELFLEVSPHNVLTETTDGFGNRILTDRITQEHMDFSVYVSGIAEVDFALREKEALNGIYKYPSQYTHCGAHLLDVVAVCRSQCADKTPMEIAALVMAELRSRFQYQSGATSIHTTAEEALAGGKGVCQDYAHMQIAVCRALGVPARYVVGMQEGTGETHAWAEIYDSGIWVGIDPTNNKWVDERYLTLSHGRDFADCGINRGLFIGGGTQTQTVEASVRVVGACAGAGVLDRPSDAANLHT